LEAKQIERQSDQGARGLIVLDERELPRDRWLVRHRVPLAPGRNEIAVVAMTDASRNQAVTARIHVTSRREETEDAVLHVLAVGVSEFANPAFNLQYAHRDAEKFVELCLAQEALQPGQIEQGPLYGKVVPQLLVNQQATAEKIREAMDQIAKEIKPRDTLIVFLASHGVLDERGNYYLVTHHGDTDRLRATCLRWSDFQQFRYDLRGCRFVMFVDTCHAGGISETSDSRVHREIFSERLGAVVFAACSARNVSFEYSNWGHGAFTKAILDAVKNEDGRSDTSLVKDGLLSLAEMQLNLETRVAELTQGRQKPAWTKPEMSPDVQLFRLEAPQ
jgi:uncharacterized caspase-like protein